MPTHPTPKPPFRTHVPERVLQQLLLSASERDDVKRRFTLALQGRPASVQASVLKSVLAALEILARTPFVERRNLVRSTLQAVLELTQAEKSYAHPLARAIEKNDLAFLARIAETAGESEHARVALRAAALTAAFAQALYRCQALAKSPRAFLFAALCAAALVWAQARTLETLLLAVRGPRNLCEDHAPVLYLLPAPFARLLTQSTQRLANGLLNESFSFSAAQDLRAELIATRVVTAHKKARRWHCDGSSSLENVWEVSEDFTRLLLLLWPADAKDALLREAYDFLELHSLEEDNALETDFNGSQTNRKSRLESLAVLQGVVPVFGLASWAKAVLARAFAAVEQKVRMQSGAAAFFTAGLTDRHARRLRCDAGSAPSVGVQAEHAPHEGILQRIRALGRSYEAAAERTDTRSCRAVADGLEEKAAQESAVAGLFVPHDFFEVDCALWLEPLEALGLAVRCDENNALVRYRPEAKTPTPGVLFVFFESEAAARWWLEDDASMPEAARSAALKRFLRMDAMVRLLRALREEAALAAQQNGALVLQQGSVLAEASAGDALARALSKFVRPCDVRRVREATFAELLHGYLAHRSGGASIETGLEPLLAHTRARQLAQNSRRIRRLRSAARS